MSSPIIPTGLASGQAARQEQFVQSKNMKTDSVSPVADADQEVEVLYLAKRHRVSPAIIREIMRRAGSTERSAVERELQKGKARR
ncbi:hypothetical protein [Teichococcus aestuarii]|uniref:hypothetical protein n=1 Tax=Teichococcus aestuarii TaxID=568898 RepID=UPI003624261C